jgi:hypothetical protein
MLKKLERVLILTGAVVITLALWGSVVSFLSSMHAPMPISSPASALTVTRTRFARTMWLRIPPRTWWWINSELKDDKHYGLKMRRVANDDLRTYQERPLEGDGSFFFGSTKAIADCNEPLWIVSFADRPLTDSTVAFALRERDGEFVAIYFIRGE